MIKRFLYDRNKMIYIIAVTGVLIFVSILISAITENAKFMGVGLTLFTIAVFWNLKLAITGSGLSVGDLVQHVEKIENEAKERGEHFKRGLYTIVIPMLVIGAITIGMILLAFFTIL